MFIFSCIFIPSLIAFFQDNFVGGFGAPLVESNDGTARLIGILSNYRDDCIPVIYARVTSAREWIKLVTGI